MLVKGGAYDEYDASTNASLPEPSYNSVVEAQDDGALVLDYTTLINAVRAEIRTSSAAARLRWV